jgi:hypothetical protein
MRHLTASQRHPLPAAPSARGLPGPATPVACFVAPVGVPVAAGTSTRGALPMRHLISSPPHPLPGRAARGLSHPAARVVGPVSRWAVDPVTACRSAGPAMRLLAGAALRGQAEPA